MVLSMTNRKSPRLIVLNSAKLLILVALVIGCTASQRWSVDAGIFARIGGTFFANPQQVTAKELHLDSGALLGKSIVIEGQVHMIGKHATHMVVRDDTADILIVVTNLLANDESIDKDANKTVRILGTMERGKKGLPFVMANGINRSKATNKKAI